MPELSVTETKKKNEVFFEYLGNKGIAAVTWRKKLVIYK